MSNANKIAVVTPVFPPYCGGIGTVAFNQARVLAERGQEVTVLMPDYGYPSSSTPHPRHPTGQAYLSSERRGDLESLSLQGRGWGEGSEERGFQTELLKPVLKYGNAAWVPGLVKRLKEFDTVILQYPFFGGMRAVYQAKKKYGFKLIVNYNMDVVAGGLLAPRSLGEVGKGLVFWHATKFFLPRIIKAADFILASSEDYARHSALGKYWQSDNPKFQIISNGVDISRFAFSGAPREKIILFVGGLDKAHYFKGVEYLIKAIRMIRITSELSELSTKLVIAGRGELIERYKKLAHELGVADKVEFAGGVSDEELVRLYQNAAVTVLPSIDQSESFGIVLAESMSCGTPVIASDLPGVRSVFENNVSGFVVLPRNVEQLAERIKYVLDNPEKMREMGRAGRKLVEERYNWEKIGGKLLSLIK